MSQHSLLVLAAVKQRCDESQTPQRNIQNLLSRHWITQVQGGFPLLPMIRSDLSPEKQDFIPSAWKRRQSQTYLHYPSNMHWIASSVIAKWHLRGFCHLMFLNLNWKDNEGMLRQNPNNMFTFSWCSFAAGSFHSNLNIKCFSSPFPREGQFQRGMETLNSASQCFITNEKLQI